MPDVLSLLRSNIQERTKTKDDRPFRITAISKLNSQFCPHSSDLPYSDIILLVQTSGCGSCYCYLEDPFIPSDLVNKDSRFAQTSSHCLNIALLDAAYSTLSSTPDLLCRLEGSPWQKAETRATLILSELLRLIHTCQLDHPFMTMVGAVGNILSGLSTIPGEIKATDLDPALIGLKLGGVLVEDGNTKTLELIAQSDIALITGMTLATRTLDGIIETAKANGTLMVMFNQTGSNFSQEFIRMGIHSVVSESYPFYMFSGSTIVRIYRAPLS